MGPLDSVATRRGGAAAGEEVGIYQPRHARQKAMGAKRRPKRLVKPATKKRQQGTPARFSSRTYNGVLT